MKNFFKLIRYQNLLLLALMQLVFRYGFLNLQHINLALSDFQYVLLVLATVLIAAAGYVINNIFDQETDNENKPANVIVGKSISETAAYNLYAALNITGVGIGFYLSNVIGKPGTAAIFIIVAATLYLYASTFKQMLVVGNLIVALLLALSVLIVPVFDLYPITNESNQKGMATLFSVIFDYAVFAFLINFIREIVKDLEDINGDYNQGMNTLPIALGKSRTTKLVFGFSIIPIVLLLVYTNKYFFTNNLLIAVIYTLALVISPLIYFSVKMLSAKTTKDFHHLSTVLKLVILSGVLSIAVVSYNILQNA